MATNINDNQGADLRTVAQQRFTRSLADANDLRLAGLSDLVHAAQAHTDSLKQDQARIAKKYGPNAKQTAAAGQALAAAQYRQPLLQAELTRTKITVPKSDPDAAILYGRILDKNYAGVGGAVLTVAGKMARGAAATLEAKTNADGLFTLRLPPQEGTANIDFEIRDQKGSVTQIEDTLNVRPGALIYREYTTQPSE